MTVYLTGAFSLSMMAKDAKFPLHIEELSEESFREELQSASRVTGHEAEAKALSSKMGVVLAMTRTEITIERGDVVLCALQQAREPYWHFPSGTMEGYRYFLVTT